MSVFFSQKKCHRVALACRYLHLGPGYPRVGDGGPDAALGGWLGPKPRHLCLKQKGLEVSTGVRGRGSPKAALWHPHAPRELAVKTLLALTGLRGPKPVLRTPGEPENMDLTRTR